MKTTIQMIMVYVVISLAIWIVVESWNQTCLGIFEEKWQCESNRKHEVIFKDCAKHSWEMCESLDHHTLQYDTCLDNVRCSCMSGMGENGCYSPSFKN